MGIDFVVAPKFSGRVLRRDLLRVARSTLRAEKVPPTEGVTIAIVGDRMIRDLNRRFLHVDAPTDVLSFSSGEASFLGDIVISYEMAARNARAFRWRVRDELSLLVVHGMLHLLGYEDSTPRARDEMWKRQEQILRRLAVNGAPSSKRRVRSRSRRE